MMKTSPRREQFISFWIILVLLLVALLVLALFLANPAAAQDDDTAAIESVAAEMQAAILAGDAEEYLTLVDLSDPVFAREHRYWAADMAGPGAVEAFELTLADISVMDNEATATIRLHWKLRGDHLSQFAAYPVQFNQDAYGNWRYAGEAWTTVENEPFLVHAASGAVDAAEPIADALPEIFDHVTGSLDHRPDGAIHIKLYDDMSDLTASVALSLPGIRGWNEPGEGIKLVIGDDEREEDWSSVLAHELTHYVTFDMAGTTRGNYPWWLAEGIAIYVATPYWDDAEITAWWETIDGLYATGQWAAWDDMTIFEETPRALWGQVYPQGYAMVSYLTEIEGVAARNAWLDALGEGLSLEEATESVFGQTFDELDAGLMAWLESRIPAS